MRYSTFSLLTSLLISLFGFAPVLVSAQQQGLYARDHTTAVTARA